MIQSSKNAPQLMVTLQDLICIGRETNAFLHTQHPPKAITKSTLESHDATPGVASPTKDVDNGSNLELDGASDRSTWNQDHIRIRTSVVPGRKSCSLLCACQCHAYRSFELNNKWLTFAVGVLFIGYSGPPLFSTSACSESRCASRTASTVKLTYYFPTWMLKRMVSFMTSKTRIGPQKMLLNVARVVSPDSDIFTFAQQGYTDGIRMLFEQGMASPFDVSAANGRSALNVSKSTSRSQQL